MGALGRLGIFGAIWAIRDALTWYLDVAENQRPAKFRIAATVATNLDPAAANEEALWAELERLTPVFLARWEAIRAGAPLPEPSDGPSLLELCCELAYRMLAHCNFCRWDCRVDRCKGVKLGAGSRLRLKGEQPFPSHRRGVVDRGVSGSGTIFFTSCNMRCAFCQNGDISTDKDNGEEVDARVLAAMAWTLRREGCHNINWVGGEVVIYLHTIAHAIALLGRGFVPSTAGVERARSTKADRFLPFLREVPEFAEYGGGFNVPILWNSNFFMTPELMKILRILTDVWMPASVSWAWAMRDDAREDAVYWRR